MGSVVFVITLVALFGVIALLASARAGSGLRSSLARARGHESATSEATLTRPKNNVAGAEPRHTCAFQLRVQVAQSPFESTPPR
ncbi:MAG: hypothetical protein ABSA78_02010 [Candidatus Sulfotelmatobacter sp.]|jgi:hypothetical protein